MSPFEKQGVPRLDMAQGGGFFGNVLKKGLQLGKKHLPGVLNAVAKAALKHATQNSGSNRFSRPQASEIINSVISFLPPESQAYAQHAQSLLQDPRGTAKAAVKAAFNAATNSLKPPSLQNSPALPADNLVRQTLRTVNRSSGAGVFRNKKRKRHRKTSVSNRKRVRMGQGMTSLHIPSGRKANPEMIRYVKNVIRQRLRSR